MTSEEVVKLFGATTSVVTDWAQRTIDDALEAAPRGTVFWALLAVEMHEREGGLDRPLGYFLKRLKMTDHHAAETALARLDQLQQSASVTPLRGLTDPRFAAYDR